ncbi:MAG: hypothetical protein ACE37K_00965 [Planctomycetota bacterium]
MPRSSPFLVVLLGGAATLSSCLSSGPPAPPVRWFDPTAAFGTAERGSPVEPVQVRGQSHLVQDIAVRVSPFEIVYDGDHRWLMPPEEILRRAFVHDGVPITGAGRLVELTAFELQRSSGAAAARVACLVHPSREGAIAAQPLEAVVAAPDDSLPSLTLAMGQAVQQLVTQIHELPQ